MPQYGMLSWKLAHCNAVCKELFAIGPIKKIGMESRIKVKLIGV
jgi:hypothetical protein